MKDSIILNFSWAYQELIATGEKLTRTEQVNWLVSQGFKAIVSLEDIPDSIISTIKSLGLNYLFFDLDQWSDSDYFQVSKIPNDKFDEFYKFVNQALQKNQLIFVHCSGGNTRSPAMVRRFLNKNLQEKK